MVFNNQIPRIVEEGKVRTLLTVAKLKQFQGEACALQLKIGFRQLMVVKRCLVYDDLALSDQGDSLGDVHAFNRRVR